MNLSALNISAGWRKSNSYYLLCVHALILSKQRLCQFILGLLPNEDVGDWSKVDPLFVSYTFLLMIICILCFTDYYLLFCFQFQLEYQLQWQKFSSWYTAGQPELQRSERTRRWLVNWWRMLSTSQKEIWFPLWNWGCIPCTSVSRVKVRYAQVCPCKTGEDKFSYEWSLQYSEFGKNIFISLCSLF